MTAGRASALLLFAASAGCAGVTTVGGQRLSMTSAEFRTYVETVFRSQNEAITEIAFAIETEDLRDADKLVLEAAEESLLIECARLNEVAARRRDGQPLGTVREARAARAAPRCERATLDARAILARLVR